MAKDAMSLVVDDGQLLGALQQARRRLENGDSEVVLDLSAVRRIDSRALAELETLADAAQKKSGKQVLRGVSVDVYKVLKLVKLVPRFTLEN